jgi:ribonuclease HI
MTENLNDMQSNNGYSMYFDGCSKGNPGSGGAGAVIYEGSKEITAICTNVGVNVTNNYSEYVGLKIGLEKALELQIKELTVYGDSMLVIKQMSRTYKVKSENLMLVYEQCKELASMFESIKFIHVYRNENKRADTLSNYGRFVLM